MVFPLEYIAVLNIIIIGLFVLYLFIGLHKGFMLMLVNLLGTVIIFVLSYFISPMLVGIYDFSKLLNLDLGFETINMAIGERINTLAWFLIMFIAGSIILALVRPIVKVVGKIPLIKEVNSLLGAVFGLIKAYIIVLILIFVFTMPIISNGSIVINSSILNPIFESTSLISSVFKDPTRINQIFQDIENGNILDEEKIQDLQDWLNKNFNDINIEDFIKSNNE